MIGHLQPAVQFPPDLSCLLIWIVQLERNRKRKKEKREERRETKVSFQAITKWLYILSYTSQAE